MKILNLSEWAKSANAMSSVQLEKIQPLSLSLSLSVSLSLCLLFMKNIAPVWVGGKCQRHVICTIGENYNPRRRFAVLNIRQPVIFTKCKVALKSRYLTFNYQLMIDWGAKEVWDLQCDSRDKSDFKTWWVLQQQQQQSHFWTLFQINWCRRQDWDPVNQNILCFWSNKKQESGQSVFLLFGQLYFSYLVNCISPIRSTVFLLLGQLYFCS